MALRVGLLGLGIMGSAYAGHLLDAGFPLTGYDVDPAALERFRARGGEPVDSPKALAERSDVVIAALASEEAVEIAYFGEHGIAAGASRKLIVIEAGTFPLETKERIRSSLAEPGALVLDAPVSGTGAQAQSKDLVWFASGDEAAFERAREVMAATGRDVRYLGAFGNGSKLKFIANLLVTIHNLSTAEALVLAVRAGIDPQTVIDVLGESAAGSRMLQVRGPMMVAQNYEPASMKLDVYRKDIEIIDAFAKSLGSPTPLFSMSIPFYYAALSQERGEQDTAAIVEVLRAMAK